MPTMSLQASKAAALSMNNAFNQIVLEEQSVYNDDPLSFLLDINIPVDTSQEKLNLLDEISFAEDIDEIADAYGQLINDDMDGLTADKDSQNIEDISQMFDLLSEFDSQECRISIDDNVPLNQYSSNSSDLISEEDSSVILSKISTSNYFGISNDDVHRMSQFSVSSSNVNMFLYSNPVDLPLQVEKSKKSGHSLISLVPVIPIPRIDSMSKSRKRSTDETIHDESTCDICSSGKSTERKRILHRFREKRKRRNWSRGPRYSARSSVAFSRSRSNGRFSSVCKWE